MGHFSEDSNLTGAGVYLHKAVQAMRYVANEIVSFETDAPVFVFLATRTHE